jgi:hypothetical protein
MICSHCRLQTAVARTHAVSAECQGRARGTLRHRAAVRATGGRQLKITGAARAAAQRATGAKGAKATRECAAFATIGAPTSLSRSTAAFSSSVMRVLLHCSACKMRRHHALMCTTVELAVMLDGSKTTADSDDEDAGDSEFDDYTATTPTPCQSPGACTVCTAEACQDTWLRC